MTKPIYILGIIYSRNSTVCLLKDGQIVSAVSEEKFSRIKNDDAFPVRAITWTLAHEGIEAGDLTHIALSTVAYQGHDTYQILKKFSSFSIEDYVREQTHYWKPLLFENKSVSYIDVFKHRINQDQYESSYWERYLTEGAKTDYRVDMLRLYFGSKMPSLTCIDHHRAHAAYGYYASPMRGKDCLVITADAFGDGKNASIWTIKNGVMTRVFDTAKFTAARLYKFMTLLLGMKPNDHEYKVMGLAPYAHPAIAAKPYEVFSKTLCVDGLDFTYHEKPADAYFYFKEKLEGCRFDGIAGGLQKFLEDLLVTWTRNIIRQFGIRNVVYSGGISMNMKAMGKIAQMPEVDDFFVCGTGSDESTALGAAYAMYEDILQQKGVDSGFDERIASLANLYLGPEIETSAIEALKPDAEDFHVQENPSIEEVARLLAEGKVLGRCCGRTEFGARALGNRSILADPRSSSVVSVINDQIKNRDFWMPFAPLILDRFADRYLVNPKGLAAPFMTVGFETTELALKHLPAALHPADKSARPQVLTRAQNPELYELILAFEKLTGVGALLNTSFNLHGHPIVNTPQDALEVMEKSFLDALWLPTKLIHRKRRQAKPAQQDKRLVACGESI